MSTKDIISLLLERGNAMQAYWGFYITISFGLIVFFGNAKHSPRTPYLAALVTIVFVGFAYVNCGGMVSVSAQRNFLYETLVSFSPSEPLEGKIIEGFSKFAKPDKPDEVRNFHIASDIAVLIAIWFLTLWKGKKASDVVIRK